MSWKHFSRKRSWLNQAIIPEFGWSDSENMKNLYHDSRRSGRTSNSAPPYYSLQRYLYDNLFGAGCIENTVSHRRVNGNAGIRVTATFEICLKPAFLISQNVITGTFMYVPFKLVSLHFECEKFAFAITMIYANAAVILTEPQNSFLTFGNIKQSVMV
jgi:hypothetical protein